MQKTKAAITLLLMIASLQSCVVNTAPEQQPDYAAITSLQAVAGCYRNLAESAASTTPRYLSQNLWPSEGIDHRAIEYIEVVAVSETTLRTSAIGAGGILRQSEFVEGEDFTLTGGKLTISSQLAGSFAAPADNPFIGVMHTSITLGVDQAGDGKLTESGTLAGTAFLIIPVAGHFSDSVRFVRTGSSCDNSH